MSDWDVATWAQVVIAATSLVVAVAATLVAWLTYRFTIDSQSVDFEFVVDERPSPPGVIPMHVLCRSPRAYLHQIWSPTWEGGDPDSVPTVQMFGMRDEEHADCPRSTVSQGDVLMFSVAVPTGVTSFELVASASVDRRGRVRNVWSERIVVDTRSGSTSGGRK